MSEISTRVVIFFGFLLTQCGFASANSVLIDNATTLIDANYQPYNKLVAGDTLFLQAGNRDYLLFRNFQGKPQKAFVLINSGGVVVISTDHYFGISFQNCSFFKLTGSGVVDYFYGIKINHVTNGAGIGIGLLSTDFEVDHISISDVLISGIIAKSDPDCLLTATRGNFTQYNTLIHDNYIENSGNEGMYIGSTKYLGQTVRCDGQDLLLMPSLLDGVKIYNNIIKYSGWDGIQVSSATHNCQVYDNIILFDSQAEVLSQMSGIILGGGSKCDCYNNYISDGKGDGIENHGLGGNRIFNNIVVNAGKTYLADDLSGPKMKHGIYVTDISVQKDSSFFIQNNTIINPKSDGIRFSSIVSRKSLISSNVNINPGNFDYYDNDNTHFTGMESNVMLQDNSSDILLKNNYFARNLTNSGLLPDFSLDKNSPLIDAGYANQPKIGFDFKYHIRRSDNPPDIGAYEYDTQTGLPQQTKRVSSLILFPNPVKTELTIKFNPNYLGNTVLLVYNIAGLQVFRKEITGLSNESQSLSINVGSLVPGVYLYSVKTGNQLDSGKFLKVN